MGDLSTLVAGILVDGLGDMLHISILRGILVCECASIDHFSLFEAGDIHTKESRP